MDNSTMSQLKPCNVCGRDYFPLRLGSCHNCYMKNRNKVGYQSTYVDAQPVRSHIEKLRASGWKLHDIAKAAGLADSSVQYILLGRPSRKIGPAKRVAGKTATALLSVNRKETAP